MNPICRKWGCGSRKWTTATPRQERRLPAVSKQPGSRRGSKPPTGGLYRFGNGYRLVIYPGFVTPRGMSGMLSEFGKLVGEGDAAAAFTAEHGQPLAIGDAVEQLGRCS